LGPTWHYLYFTSFSELAAPKFRAKNHTTRKEMENRGKKRKRKETPSKKWKKKSTHWRVGISTKEHSGKEQTV